MGSERWVQSLIRHLDEVLGLPITRLLHEGRQNQADRPKCDCCCEQPEVIIRDIEQQSERNRPHKYRSAVERVSYATDGTKVFPSEHVC